MWIESDCQHQPLPCVQELCAQQRMFRNLVARNRDEPEEQLQRQLAANGGVGRNPVQLPFILI